jgi:hypothetical protein
MARPLRIEYEGAFYHITSRGNERGSIFFAPSDYDKFKGYLRDLILEMILKDRKGAHKRYRAFVEKARGEGHESPLKGIYAGVILGSQAFIRHILERLQNDRLEKAHVSHRRALTATHTSDTVIDTLCARCNITAQEVFNNGGHWRNVAIYLIKKFTGLPNRQVGELFGGLSYSAVAKAYQRFSARLGRDKTLRKVIEECSGVLS